MHAIDTSLVHNDDKPVVDEVLYTQYFGLREQPFQLTPDGDYFFSHASAQDAMNKLLFATRTGEGFIKVTGEVGTGKTMLCRAFLDVLDDQYVTAYVPNPYMEPMTLLQAIADELGVKYLVPVNQHDLLKQLTHFLIESYRDTGKTVVICLDEVHAMPLASMEVLRLLSNLETAKRKLIQLVLFGQPELNQRLEQTAIRQLRQRISFSAVLQNLSMTETQDYIHHRLSVAGYSGPRLFNHRAIRRIWRMSHGVPRLINILCHKALIAAYAEGRYRVGLRQVELAIDDTDTIGEPLPASSYQLWRNYLTLLAVGSVITAALSWWLH